MADFCKSILTQPNPTLFDRKEYEKCKIMEASLAQGAKIYEKATENLIQVRPERFEARSESIRASFEELQFHKEINADLSALIKFNLEGFPKEARYLRVGYVDNEGIEHTKTFVGFTGDPKKSWVTVNYTGPEGEGKISLRPEEHQAYKNHLKESLKKNFRKSVFEVMDPSHLKPSSPEQLEKMAKELGLISERILREGRR